MSIPSDRLAFTNPNTTPILSGGTEESTIISDSNVFKGMTPIETQDPDPDGDGIANTP